MRRFVVAVTLIIIIAGSATLAAANPITLQAAALHDRPAVVTVDAQDVTTITFCRSITWSAYKAPWLHATVSAPDKRVLLLDASATGAETTVMVWVEGDGMPLQLLVRASAQELGNHLYTVTCPAPAPAEVATSASPEAHPSQPGRPQPSQTPATPQGTPTPPPAPAMTPLAQGAAWQAFTNGLTSHQWDLLMAFVASPSPDTQAVFADSLTTAQQADWVPLAGSRPALGTTSAPTTQSQGAPTTPPALPSWLPWHVHVTANDSGTLVSYNLQNTGQVAVVLDIARLRVTASDGTLVAGVAITRQDTSGLEGRVAPGGVESGVIRIPAVPQGGAVLLWPVVAVDSGGTTYQISQPVP